MESKQKFKNEKNNTPVTHLSSNKNASYMVIMGATNNVSYKINAVVIVSAPGFITLWLFVRHACFAHEHTLAPVQSSKQTLAPYFDGGITMDFFKVENEFRSLPSVITLYLSLLALLFIFHMPDGRMATK